MLITKLFNPIYQFIVHAFAAYKARQRKRESERALARLDARLLKDVGLCRVQEEIVPIKSVVRKKREQVQPNRRYKKFRSRHPYLIRRRQE